MKLKGIMGWVTIIADSSSASESLHGRGMKWRSFDGDADEATKGKRAC